MKLFDPDSSLRSCFRVRYAEVLDIRASRYDPFPVFPTSPSIEHDDYTNTTWSTIDSQSQYDDSELLDPLDPWSTPSGITYPIIISPSSTETFEPATSLAQPVPTTLVRKESSTKPDRQRKRQRSSKGDLTNDRCRSTPVPPRRITNLKHSVDRRKHSTDLPWAKSILIRMKPGPDQIVNDLRYTFVKLPAPDVQCCIAAICAKMEIPFVKRMPVSWYNSETLLRGPFDHKFLENMVDMQDFVLDLVEIGDRGDIGLLLEM